MRFRARPAVMAAAALASLAAVPVAAAHNRHRPPVALELLAINDFHGQLEKAPATSSSGVVTVPGGVRVPAGGAEYLASHLDRLRAEAHARGARTLTVAAGDLIGATPLLSAAFHDEPTIDALNLMGLDVASVGNHEFDEGYRELQRMQYGGCLDDGDGRDNQNSCPDPERPFTGAEFSYLAANAAYARSGRTILPAFTVRWVRGVPVAFIGVTLEDTPNIVTKSGVEGLRFGDEVETINRLVPRIRRFGIESIVVLMHEGGVPSDTAQYDTCAGVAGPGIDIARQVSPAVDVVITGHTHQSYNCVVLDPAGNPRVVTSASSIGRVITRIQLQISRRNRDVIRPTVLSRNLVVSNTDVAPRADITELIARYRGFVAPIAERVLGRIEPEAVSNMVTRTADPDGGDSPLGNLIADSQRADTSAVPPGGRAPSIVFMNPGGIRTDLVENPAGQVTYAAAFAVQPFNNYVVTKDLTGQQVWDVLNEQWNGRNETARKILQVSGLTYTWDRSDAAGTGNAVVAGSVMVDHDADPATAMVPLDLAATYRVGMNSFLSDGGDGFATLAQGTNRFYGGLDIDALASYLAARNPYTVTPTDRIRAVD